MTLRVSTKDAERLSRNINGNEATSSGEVAETAQNKRSAPQPRIDSPAGKSRPVKPRQKISYQRACESGWQLRFKFIGNGNVACRAHNRTLGKTTAWLTDETDGRDVVLAALAQEAT